MKRLMLAALIAVFVGLNGLTIFQLWLRSPDSQPTTLTTAQVPQATVVRGLGYVEPVSEVRRLVFKVDGVIAKVPVQVGQCVSAGAVLASLQNGDERAAVEEAEQQLVLATAQRQQLLAGIHPDEIAAGRRKVELLREQHDYAEKHRQRVNNLAKKKAIAAEELDRADTQLRQAQKGLLQAEAELARLENHVRGEDRVVADAQVGLARSRLQVARQRLENTLLKAPFDGTVLEINKREGEGARVIDREPVVIFADTSRLRVRAEIDERYVHDLAAGEHAQVYGRGLGDQRVQGDVVLVKRLMGGKTVFSRESSERKDLDVLQVLIDLPPDFSAPLGLQVDVDIAIGTPRTPASPPGLARSLKDD